MNPLLELRRLGQSVWLDDIRRSWLLDGTLARLIATDGLAGVTSNPSIFEKAIAHGAEYDASIRDLIRQGLMPEHIYEILVIEDVRAAADLLRSTYDASAGADGYVSLEVAPHLAHDTRGTCEEAERLWQAVNRPNVMIKVPATQEGLPAIRTLLARGINVNITLLFGLERYRAVAEAFISALEERVAADQPIERVASVASFFISRIDALVDQKLDALKSPHARALRGMSAISAARLAYRHYRQWSRDARWQRLAQCGARPQRLLWASTSTKDPTYPDTLYVDALIGPETVTTLPWDTFTTYRNHGRPAARLNDDLERANRILQELAKLGLDLEDVATQLEREGIEKFIEPFDRLHQLLAERAASSP